MGDANDVLKWSEALAGVARTGLSFTESLYERERFEEVLRIAAEMRTSVGTVLSGEVGKVDEVVDAWIADSGKGVAGYVTPKVAVGAAVRKGDELLLIQRSDSLHWLYPTGWADIGYSPAEVALKEVFEETAIRAKVIRPIAIFDSFRIGISKLAFYSIIFLCDYVGGDPVAHPLECRDVGWFGRDMLPRPLAGHAGWVDVVFGAFDDPASPVYVDLPREDLLPGS